LYLIKMVQGSQEMQAREKKFCLSPLMKGIINNTLHLLFVRVWSVSPRLLMRVEVIK